MAPTLKKSGKCYIKPRESKDCVIIILLSCRYEQNLISTHWYTVRKGAALGTLIGWFYFIKFLIYCCVFIFGVLLMPHDQYNKRNVMDILMVSNTLTVDDTLTSPLLFRLLLYLQRLFLI